MCIRRTVRFGGTFARQFGAPGAPELLVLVSLVVLPFAPAYWTDTDARRRDEDSAALWTLAVGALTVTTFVGGVVALAVCVRQRDG